MKNKHFIGTLIAVALITFIVSWGLLEVRLHTATIVKGESISTRQISDTIVATGSIHSQQEATLHFPTTGKVVYLPFKQGDTVYSGQTIASLDTYALQKQLQIQANAYQIAKNSNDQVQENNQASVLEGQQRVAFDTTNHNAYSTITEAGLITDTVRRLVDNSQLSQNTAQLQVDLANYAIQLASLTAPFTGTLIQEDITTPGIIVTPTTSFTLADPSQKIFRAQVAASDIDFVSVGATAKITLDGQKKSLDGTVIMIYPQKQILSTGQEVYLVDIQSASLQNSIFGENGSVLISSNTSTSTVMVPTWTIVGHTSVWVWDGKKSVLRSVQVGKTHQDMTEITGGLLPTDTIISKPQTIVKQQYAL